MPLYKSCMYHFLLIFLAALHVVFAIDYDCIFVGSSPIPLFEAIYQRSLGKKVLILEQGSECGGAWKAIDICGVPHVDLGCHQIGGDPQLRDFLEIYGGCKIVSMDKPTDPKAPLSSNGFYFSQGCYELIRSLTCLINATGIDLLLNHRVDSVYVDTALGHATVKVNGKQLTTSKVFYTQMTSFHIENIPHRPAKGITKYPHLYLLIQDPTPPKFSYMNYGMHGASRAMNLTHFANLANTGRQLVVFQVHGEDACKKGELFVDDLKKRKLLDPSAYILKSELYTYELCSGAITGIPPQLQPYFEMINASSFGSMSSYIHKWKKALKPYREILIHQ